MSDDISIEKLTRVYNKMRSEKEALVAQLDSQIKGLDSSMKKVKTAILEQMKDLGVESLKTPAGTVYRTVKTIYTTNDWDSMGKFIVEHNATELLERRLHQGNMKTFLEENPDVLPPGLNANSEYSVTIRRK